MKIACIIHSLTGGGAERVMAGLSSRLARRGHQVTLITLDDGCGDPVGVERRAVDDRVIRRPLDVLGATPSGALSGALSGGGNPFARLAGMRQRIRSLRNAIDQSAPDVALSFCDRTNVLTLLASGHTGVPVVVSERSDPSQQQLGPIWERLRKAKYKQAAAIVALTPSSAQYLQRSIGKPAVVIPSAVERPPHASDRTTAQSNQRIVGLGRLEHEKGFDRLLHAFADLLARSPQLGDAWKLRIIGEGSQRGRLEHQAKSLGLEDRLTMPGWVDPVWDELAAATLFVLPSRYEGFPSALLEAMAMGVPSIAVDCESGPRVVVDHRVNGMLVRNDLPALTQGMLEMVQDPALREPLGAAGRRVADQFSWDRMVDAYEQLLEQVSGRGSHDR